MKNRTIAWLISVALIGLAISSHWWSAPLVGSVGAKSDLIPGLAVAIQFAIWGLAVVALCLGLWQHRKRKVFERSQHYAPQSGSGGLVESAVGTSQHGVAGGESVHGRGNVGGVQYDPAEALALYRQWLVNGCRQLPLRGIDTGAGEPTGGYRQLELDQVYISLDTTEQIPIQGKAEPPQVIESRATEPHRTRPLSALESAAAHRRLVILGNPGSGKSTFLNHLTLCLAQHALEPTGDWLKRLPGWPSEEHDLLPIPVVLRDFARSAPAPNARPEPRWLWNFIVAQLRGQNLESAAEPLEHALAAGKALVLLDGLDEISAPDQRAFVHDVVQAFAQSYPSSRFLVTCRTMSYKDPNWRLPEFAKATLAPFSEAGIGQFINAWYANLAQLGAVKPDNLVVLMESFQKDIRRPDVWRLAANPLLLTAMALVHSHKGRLPEARAVLYEDAVDILLWRWEQLKIMDPTEPPGLGLLLLEARRSDVDLKRALSRLAFEAHQERDSQNALADIGQEKLEQAFANLHPEQSLAWAHKFIEMIRLRSGLLVERSPQRFAFPHRTFQEYLAGGHLASQPDFARQGAQLVGEDPFWRGVIVQAVAKLVHLQGDTERPLVLAGELCPVSQGSDDPAWRKAWLAGEVLLEIGKSRVPDTPEGRELFARVRDRLVRLLEAEALPPVERAAAGVALGNLGDPRRGVGVKNGLPDIDWIEIDPGPFLMGSEEEGGMLVEKPQFECRLVQKPYLISRYPVTVAQYQAFVQADGYLQPRFWTPDGWQWRQSENVQGPADYEFVFQTPNHPRVGVNWYEAAAFCRWLTEKLGYEVRLPNEPEWERAARHTDGRRFPWGNEEEAAQRCNTFETGIDHTSAVGLFPSGNAACGAADLAGNVWEWTRSLWGKGALESRFVYPYQADDGREDFNAPSEVGRVVRGATFHLDWTFVRCAFRYGLFPYARANHLGVRLVASPFKSGR